MPDVETEDGADVIRQQAYEGPERRSQAARMHIAPTNEWWSRVTLPILISVILHAGAVVWWASKIQEQINGVIKDQEQLNTDLLRQNEQLLGAIYNLRSEFNKQHTVLLKHLLEKSR